MYRQLDNLLKPNNKDELLKQLWHQSTKRVTSGCPGQVEFSAGQVTFHSHLPEGQGGSPLPTKILKK